MPPDDDSSSQRIAALERTVARLEQELSSARSSLQRSAVQQALLDDRLLILERNRLFRLWDRIYRGAAGIYSRIAVGQRFGGLSDLRTPGDYARWMDREEQEMAAEEYRGSSRPLISVCLKGSEGALESVQSVVAQSYADWELCVGDAVEGFADSRIRVVEQPSGEYQLTLHAGDRLSRHALHFYAQALANEAPDLVYADEDRIDSDGNCTDPLFKPGWSPELLRSTMYLGRAVLHRRRTTVGEICKLAHPRVVHIPRVVYHRAKSTPLEPVTPQYAAPPDARVSIIICTRNLGQVRECMAAIRYTAKVSLEILVVQHMDSGGGGEMQQSVEQDGARWLPYRGPFDFARMNNLAASQATSPYLLFLNDDVIVQESGWDQGLTATLARQEIGIAGAILEYPNGTLQHAGVVVGMGDGAGHCGRFQKSSELWPWLRMTRDVSAVTGAMLGIRSDVFEKLGGFDETFPVNYNDVDLCLRVRQEGLRVVCLNVGKVIHRESQTRVGGTRYEEREALYKRWAEVLAKPDEFYSLNLAPVERIQLNTGRRPLQELV